MAGTFDRGSADRFVGDVEEAVEEKERDRLYLICANWSDSDGTCPGGQP